MRIAIISDIHEDIVNLEKILKKIEGTGYDQLVCLGDISGFSTPYYTYHDTRNAHACLSLLREKNAMILPGNHDFHAAKRIPLESDIFDFPGNWYEMDFRERHQLAQDRIWLHEMEDLDPLYSNGDIDFLRTLPEYQVLNTEKYNILFSHYAFPNLSGFEKGFYTDPKDFRLHFDFMREQHCTISFTGHAHVKGIYTVLTHQFRHYSYRPLTLKNFPVCIGIHPVNRNHRRSGFCIFDTGTLVMKALRHP